MASEEDFDLEKDLPRFLAEVLDKFEYLFQGNFDVEAAEAHAEVLDQTISLVRSLKDCCSLDTRDKENLDSIAEAFGDVLCILRRSIITPSTVATDSVTIESGKSGSRGRPCLKIPVEMLEELRGLGFTWTRIAEMLGVSRWTIHRRIAEYGLEDMRGFDDLSDEKLDEIIKRYISNHGRATGCNLIAGFLKSVGLRIQRRRIRERLAKLDPQNTALRWGAVVERRKYQVPWPNSLWHLDGHHSLIRWKLVIHGCIDGFSRRIMFLRCSSNNKAETVLELFLNAVKSDGDLWPSRIRVDYGVENVLVCDAMVKTRGEGRGSFIAGPSTHNQRIERLWRDVFRCVSHLYYYTFYGMELSGILNADDPVHLFTLHLVFLPRINQALSQFTEAFNHHNVRTERNWSPYQMWLNGMMHHDNPLSNGETDEEPYDFEYYANDPYGPTPLESDNNVVVEEIDLGENYLLQSFVLERVDPLRESIHVGIDIFQEALELVSMKLGQLAVSGPGEARI